MRLRPLGIIRDDDKYWMFELAVVRLHGELEVARGEGGRPVHLFINNMVSPPDVDTHNVTVFS